MSLDHVKRQLLEQIKQRAHDRYIDRNEEREVLQIAVQQGFPLDSARAMLAQVCEAQGYLLESRVLAQVKDRIDISAGNAGRVDEKEFNDAVSSCTNACQGKRNESQCKRMVVEIIEDNSYRVKTGLFSNWYARAKKDVGMA